MSFFVGVARFALLAAVALAAYFEDRDALKKAWKASRARSKTGGGA